ncbi:unnamed protein product [Urochloa decumbens]|uniref:Protein kinase domain-containing protein n=1 Tax=Urochloa decumbens TaxID=240449 RepID=A0ABC9DNK1_9POAL
MLCLAAFLLLTLAPPPAAAAAAAGAMAAVAPSPAANDAPSLCPYDLATAAQMIPRECHANATAAPGATGCCWYVFAAYIFAAADHANRTGEAFLPPGPAAACSDAFASALLAGGLVSRSLLAGEGSCDLTGDQGKQLAAGSRPCQLAGVAAVRALAPVALPNATRLCAAPGAVGPGTPGCSACRAAVIATTYEMLAAARTREFVPCGMAATVAVWSAAPPPLDRYEAYALCMLQVLENVNSLGTGDIVPSPPPPAAAATTMSLPPAPAASRSSSSRNKNIVPVAAGTAAAGVLAVVCFSLAVVAITRTRRQRCRLQAAVNDGASGGDEEEDVVASSLPPLPREGLYIFTKAELMQATNGYDKTLLLGTGGAGKVYLGHLPSGQRVAIKRIYRAKKVSEFYAEVAVLARLRHRNLTTLLGYCLANGGDHALVYEYMAGGNLWRALFQGGGELLPWRRRLEVAADVAEGLAYLHGFPGGAVVHRDVKPANILLSGSGSGSGAAAKLSDFGVSRVLPAGGGTHVSTEVRGTRGYVDPESFAAGHVSEAADVYGFGVVLLELATGLRAVVPTPSGGAESIVQAAHWAVAETGGGDPGAAADAMVDRRLGPAWDRPTMRRVFALACRCVRPYKHERPEIAEVLSLLKGMLADYDARLVNGDNCGSVLLPDAAETSESTASSAAATPELASAPSTSLCTLNTK